MEVNKYTSLILSNLKNQMDFNGYAWFDESSYKAKGNLPCFIPENAEDIRDVFSWNDLFEEALSSVKTKDFLLAVCENYEDFETLKEVEKTEESKIDYETVYTKVVNETPSEFAESFMDDYFLSGGEVWCYLSTRIEDYKN